MKIALVSARNPPPERTRLRRASEPHEAGDTGGKVMALGAGALLLAAGVYAARRTFWR